jgi:hypothetical protein
MMLRRCSTALTIIDVVTAVCEADLAYWREEHARLVDLP